MSEHVVYRHEKRADWGLAIVLEALQDRTTFLFERVGPKTLGAKYLHMMAPAELDPAEAEAAYQRISKLHTPRASSPPSRAPAPVKKPDLTFEQQLEVFAGAYPGWFEDERYLKEERGPEEGKGGHKQAAILRAATELSADALAAAEPAQVFETVRSLLQACKKLVSHADAAKLAKLDEGAYPVFAERLAEVLHGEGPYPARFDQWVAAIAVKPRPNWPLATLLPALVHPAEHVFVKPTFFRTQAAILELDGSSGSLPDGAAYTRALAVAKAVSEKLQAAGHPPRDLWDVSAFMFKTASVRHSKPPAA